MPYISHPSLFSLLRLTLALFSQNSAAAMLDLDITDTNSYGYAFNDTFSNEIVAEFEFSQTSGALLLSLDAFDIDTAAEVSVELNGTRIGYLPKSENNGMIASSFQIPFSQQTSGTNKIRFIQSTPGWIWGVTNLTLSALSNSLQLGVTNTDKYGNRFLGVSNYPTSVSFSIPSSTKDLQLSLQAYDIDTSNEVSINLNGQSFGVLETTSNNSLAPQTLTIPASRLNGSVNEISFSQSTPGWIWGITELLLLEKSAITLEINSSDDNKYGFAYDNIYNNRDSVQFEFNSTNTDLILSLDTFDIDSMSEVSVLLNSQNIGTLSTTENNAEGSSTFIVPLSEQVSGLNTIEFVQSVPGWVWGIKNVLLAEETTVRLTVDSTHTRSYGYSFKGINTNLNKAEFVFTGTLSNLNLVLTTYDIDDATEVSIELNDELIGHLLTTSNDSEGVTELMIPSHLQIAGDNTLIFRQRNPNWRWGIKNLLLQSQPNLLPDISNYELTFSDEFDLGSLDPSKWKTSFLWGPYLPINNEQQLYVDTLGINEGFNLSPFTFSDDTLTISATSTSPQLQPPPRPAETDQVWDNYAEYQYNGPGPNGPGYQPSDVDYLSGIITSYDSFKMTHGYVEARVKLPAGKGLWPAFWLLNTHYVEDAPEIDVMEFLGDDISTVYHTYHYFDTSNGWQKISTPSFETTSQNWTNNFHTFGLAWSPKELVWYVDGIETKRITDSEYKISGQAMYLLANLAVGGTWPGSPDGSTNFPAEYEIDYIRAYKRKLSDTLDLANDYQLMFNDEFEGTTLDTAKWNTAFLWGPYYAINNEEQYYVDSNGTDKDKSYSPFTVSNGVLTITAQDKALSAADVPPANLPSPGEQIWLDNPAFQQGPYPNAPNYTSGMITSYDAFKFINGYAEIRAKVPAGDGLWPAFWLLNAYYVGALPEIDIMEILGENPNQAYHTFHRFNSNGVIVSDQQISNGGSDALGYADDFHTFGVRWQPGKITWYVDGSPVHTYEESDPNKNDAYQLMYVIANLAVGGNFNSQPVDEAMLPAKYEIDYIRVYQETDTP